MDQPKLVYHGTLRLYPEAGDATPQAMAAIRFPQPVRLSSLRVIPHGVVHPSGTGETDPEAFTAEILLNLSNAEPVNAMARTTARVGQAQHALDFKLDMPVGTTTRLVIVRAPVRRITFSLYAFNDGEGEAGPPPLREVWTSAPTVLPFPSGGELVARLPNLAGESEEVQRGVLLSLGVRAYSAEVSLASVLADVPAASALLEISSPAVDKAIRSILGLTDTSVDASAALRALQRVTSDPHGTDYPATESALCTVLALARAQRASTHPRAAFALAAVVERLGTLVTQRPETAPQRATVDLLARTLPPLAAHARARGAAPTLPVPTQHAHTVLTSLGPVCAEVATGGTSCALAARDLAKPYIAALAPTDPQRVLWTQAPPTFLPATTAAASLSRALDDPLTGSSVAHTLSASDILSVVAPDLLAELSTAPNPPLGLSSVQAQGGEGTASHYAGKVYSAHEFRRERETVSGLGMGLAGVGRKASRHVDEFGR